MVSCSLETSLLPLHLKLIQTSRAASFMNAWNPDLVSSLYPKQMPGFVTNISGRVRLQPPVVAKHYRQILSQSAPKLPADSQEMLSNAISLAKADIASAPAPPFPYTKPSFGYVTQWLSELGQADLLDGLLAYADAELDPTWDNGGLYYPRNDVPFVFTEGQGDEGIKWTHISPYCGNAAIGYARLNVKDGQRVMYEKPFTREQLALTPWIDNLDFSTAGVSVLRGVWDPEHLALVLTVKGWDFVSSARQPLPEKVCINPTARNLPSGTWAVYVDGKLAGSKDITKEQSAGGEFSHKLDVKRGQEIDIVFMKVGGSAINGHANGHANGHIRA